MAAEKEEKHMGYMEEYKFWLENDYFDQKTKEELKGIEGNNAEIEDRFYKDLEFGTGGLRGVKGNTGPCQFHQKTGRGKEGRRHRLRFPFHVP